MGVTLCPGARPVSTSSDAALGASPACPLPVSQGLGSRCANGDTVNLGSFENPTPGAYPHLQTPRAQDGALPTASGQSERDPGLCTRSLTRWRGGGDAKLLQRDGSGTVDRGRTLSRRVRRWQRVDGPICSASWQAEGAAAPAPPAGQCYYDSPMSCDFCPHAGVCHLWCGFRMTQRAECGRFAFKAGGVGTHRRQSVTGSAPRVSTCRAASGLTRPSPGSARPLGGGWGSMVLLLCASPSPGAEPDRE